MILSSSHLDSWDPQEFTSDKLDPLKVKCLPKETSPKILKKSSTVSSTKMESLNLKRTSSKNTSLKKSKKNSIHSKFWNLTKMPLKIRLNKLTESLPSNIIQKTTQLLRLKPNSLNLVGLMNKPSVPEIKRNMQI